MGEGRTNPYFLSDDETARERRRTKDMVRSIVGKSHPGESIERIDVASPAKSKATTKVSETERARL